MELMVFILLLFVGASLVLYVVLGGADYGAGILELLPIGSLKDDQKKLINYAMGPVWEANHMWLIIVVVILFMGFPPAFIQIMVALHLPMVALLIGIVVRGCAFTFRHYDAIQDEKSQKVYTWTFGLSSLWTSWWIGVIAASLFRGRINPEAHTFYEAYIYPWWGMLPSAMGLFVIFIFAFLSSVYLIGETNNVELKRLFAKRGFVLNVLVVLGGGLVFFSSWLEGGDLFGKFVTHSGALFCLIAATAMFFLLWLVVKKRKSFWTRIIAAGQTTLILFGWFFLHAPHVMYTVQGPLSFFDVAAPKETLFQLNVALGIGSLLIFPSLYWLLKVFKFSFTKE